MDKLRWQFFHNEILRFCLKLGQDINTLAEFLSVTYSQILPLDLKEDKDD